MHPDLIDLKKIFLERKALFAKAAVIGFFVAMALAALRPVEYLIEATFKEGTMQNVEGVAIKEFLLSGLKSTNQSLAAPILSSNMVMKPVIQKYGLQTRGRYPFRDVEYEGEETRKLAFQFRDAATFVVEGVEGRLGEKVVLPDVSFVCVERVDSVTLEPWLKTVKKLRKKISMTPRKGSPSIYDLKLRCIDRHVGAAVLNGLMDGYCRYLQVEHDEMATEQIAYLEKKQESLYRKMGAVFDEYAEYLKSHDGADLAQELKNYFEPFRELEGKILAIDLELERTNTLVCGAEKIHELELQQALLPRMEIASLEPMMTDIASSKELLAEWTRRAQETRSALQQSKYYSAKERARAEEELEFQKTQIAALEMELYRSLDDEVYALRKQSDKIRDEKIAALQEERRLLVKKLDVLKARAADIPERWKKESWLTLKSEVEQKIMTAMTELVESKTIGRHLHIIESKPLDRAIAPLKPESSYLLIAGLLGALSCVSLAFLTVMIVRY